MLGNNQYEAIIRGSEFPVNGEYMISSLEIKDMMGYRSHWLNDTEKQFYRETEIPIIQFKVTGGRDYDDRAPEILSIKKFSKSHY